MVIGLLKKSGLAFLVCCSSAACVFADSGNRQPPPQLITSQVETDFRVEGGKLTVTHGDKEASQSDNAYLLSALEAKNIRIDKYDYTVVVSRKQYATDANGADDLLELFHYSIRFTALKNELKKEFPVLTGSDYVETHIPLSKAPTKCYVFTSGQQLNVLCHYGFGRNEAVPSIISNLQSGG